MDCRTARLLLHFTGPPAGELGPGEARALQGHLGDCPACRDLAEAERRLDDRLGRALRDVPVPAGLRGAVLTRLGADRDAFYRRWLVRAAGAAAVLVVAAWLGWHWLGQRPTITVNDVLASAERLEEAQVKDWLHDAGGDVAAPPDFDPPQLVGYGFADVGGRRVPVLTYVHGMPGNSVAWARVYILSDRCFNLDDITQQQRGSGVRMEAVVLTYPERPGLVYVVAFTGDALDSFKQPPPSRPPGLQN